jgi:hypothetical protein
MITSDGERAVVQQAQEDFWQGILSLIEQVCPEAREEKVALCSLMVQYVHLRVDLAVYDATRMHVSPTEALRVLEVSFAGLAEAAKEAGAPHYSVGKGFFLPELRYFAQQRKKKGTHRG